MTGKGPRVIRRPRADHRPILLLLLAALTLPPGCTSLHRVTMQEMARSGRDRVSLRISEACGTLLDARAAYEACVARMTAANAAAAGAPSAAAHAWMIRSIDRLALEAWNLRRRIASVRDVGETYFEDVPDGRTLHRARYVRALEDMDEAHLDVQRVVESLRDQAVLVQAGAGSGAVRTLAAAPDPVPEARTVVMRIQAAIDSAEALLALLGAE